MGINRIRLQNGAMGDPRVDARMQQTYQQNIAANQAQQARNEGIFQAARDKLQGFGNILTSGVQAGVDRAQNIFMNQAPNRFIDYLSGRTEPVTNLSEIASTQSTRDIINQGILGSLERNQITNPTGIFNTVVQSKGGGGEYASNRPVDYSGYKLGNPLPGIKNYATEVGQVLNTMGGNAENQIANTLGDYSFEYRPPSYDFDDDYMGIKDIYDFKGKSGEGRGTPYDVNVELTDADTKQKIREQLFKDAPIIDRPTMADVAGPSRETIIQRILEDIENTSFQKNQVADMYPDQFKTGLDLDYLKTLNPDEVKLALDNAYLQGENFQNPDFSTGRIGGGRPFFRYGPEYMKKTNRSNPLSLSRAPTGYNLRNQLGELESILGKEGIDPYRKKLDDALMASYRGMSGDSDLQKRIFGLASGGRVGFQDGTDLNLTARQVAEQNPELNTIREQLFGENYLDDIEQGTGIAQYYTGFGQMPTLDYTPAAAVDTSTPAVDITQPVVDAGGGGGGGSDIDITTPDTGNTEFEQGLIDQGVGVQGAIGDPVVAPGEMPVTQEEMDVFNQIPVNREYGDLMNIGYGEGQVDPGLAAAVGGVDTTPVEVNEDLIDRGNPLNDPRIQPEEFGLVGTPEYIDPIMDPNLMNIRQQQAIDFQTPEQTNVINEAFNSVKDLGVAGVDKLKESLTALGGKVKEGFDNTIEIGGKTIDLTKSLFGGALSLATGIPGVGFALNAIQEDPIKAATKDGLEEKGYGFDDIGRLTDGPMAGYAVESAFGDGIADATLDRIDKIENRDAPQTKDSIEKVQELYDFLGDITEVKAQEFGPQEDIGAISGDLNTGVAPDGTLPDGTNIMDEFEPSDIQATDPSLEIPDRQRGDGGDNTGSTGISDAQAASNREAARSGQYDGGGGGGGGGGGKIVCTMMNDSYGFGSFRNKIWLKHSKDLAPEYQKGYHKIFLPLVKLSKNNRVLKTMLEHIAVHRTIDIRQESRGKVHLLGRVYRKILEPICYVVGKYVK